MAPAPTESAWVTNLRLVLPLLLGAIAFLYGLFTGHLVWVAVGGALMGVPGLAGLLAKSGAASTGR